MQEYVNGDNFGSLLQAQPLPHVVADIGVQLCQALLYAGSSTRGICHGDLTPAAILYDRRGLIRINGFALPSNVQYFASWSLVGGGGKTVSDPELPWGKSSDARRADDTRAVGLLLYQLLAGRPAGATSVEPPSDGRLRFLRNVPVELCEIIARTIIQQHPQHINTPETLYEELSKQVEALEPPEEPTPSSYRGDDNFSARPFTPTKSPDLPGAEKLVTALPIRDGGTSLSPFQTEANGPMIAMEPQAQQPAFPQTMPDAPLKLTSPYGAYPNTQPVRRIGIPALIFFCLLIFVAFFVIGYFVAHAILR